MVLKRELEAVAGEAFAASGFDAAYGRLTRAADSRFGDFSCAGALELGKQLSTSPRQIAEAVVVRLSQDERFAKVSIAGPGFINITLGDVYLSQCIGRMDGARLGIPTTAQPRKFVIDYGGANVAKPLHVGHLRAAIIGESIKRLGRFLGHTVIGDVHLGDWGLPMGMVIAEIQRRHPELPYFAAGDNQSLPACSPVSVEDLADIYPTASGRCKSDPKALEAARAATRDLQTGRAGYRTLWQQFRDVSVADLRGDYENLNIEFDLWLGESDVHEVAVEMISDLRDRDLAVESQGALVVHVAEPSDSRELPPLLLVKSDGGFLYGTTDLATIRQRIDTIGPDAIIYVVDKRQSDHFEQVFRAARITGIAPTTVDLEHMAAAAVARDYPEEERRVVAGDVGVAALKFGDLSNHPSRDYVFDLERFASFDGKTGPYLLYNAVRVKSILRKASDHGLESGPILPPIDAVERNLMLSLAEAATVIETAFERRTPNSVCDHAYTIASLFSGFYHEHHILNEEDNPRRSSWLRLSETVLRALELATDLLAIHIPDRM